MLNSKKKLSLTGIQKNEHYLRMNKRRVHNISNVFTIQPEKKRCMKPKLLGRMHTRVRATFRPKLKLKNKKTKIII